MNQRPYSGSLSPPRLTIKFFVEKVIKPIENDGGRLLKITMNAIDYGDIKKLGRGNLDIITNVELIRTGFVATMFNINLYVSKFIQSGHFSLEIEKDDGCINRNYCVIHDTLSVYPTCENDECIVSSIHEI